MCGLLYCVVFVCLYLARIFFFFFFNDTATTEIYTLSLHDALPIFKSNVGVDLLLHASGQLLNYPIKDFIVKKKNLYFRSEEHTSELQSPVPISYAVFCLKKKKNKYKHQRGPTIQKTKQATTMNCPKTRTSN